MGYSINLKGKTALVTGGGRGIGKAIAKGFIMAGAEVIIVSRTKSELDLTAKEIRDSGGKVYPMVCDLSDPQQITDLLTNVKSKFAEVHILANVAGMSIPSPFLEVTEKDWTMVMDVNVKAPFLLIQSIVELMIKKGIKGSIINVTSECQDVAELDLGAYNTSKGALKMLTKTVAAEFGEYGIRANNLAPSFVNTKINKPLFEGTTEKLKGFYDRKLARVPLARHSEPEDLVGAAVFLASDLSGYVTGTTLFVDGGYTAH